MATASRKPRYVFTPASSSSLHRIRKTPDPLEDYDDREGYKEDFIDATQSHLRVPLPSLSKAVKSTVQAFQWKGRASHVLHYTHFSTVHSRTRKLPILSAVNIDGKNLQKGIKSHKTWRPDPRIPTAVQLVDQIYGLQRNGFFSRGHMTRRLDPGWGDAAVAHQADEDTYHATNAAPQVQSFNDGVWGKIEDYILENTRGSRRICVMTGPVFGSSDPVVHGLPIPLQFWKVIAFLSPSSGSLAATGYVSSQAKEVAGLRAAAIFGDVENTQRPITYIEQISGLRFPVLRPIDVLSAASSTFASRLRDVRDIMLE